MNFWRRDIFGVFLLSRVFLEFDIWLKNNQQEWQMSVLRVQTTISQPSNCFQKLVFNNFPWIWEKEVWTFYETFSPRSVKVQFMCPEEVFREPILEGKCWFFSDLVEFLADFGKKTSSAIFKSAFHMPRGTFWGKLFSKKKKLIFSDSFFGYQRKCFWIGKKKFSMWSKRHPKCLDKKFDEIFFLKTCFHERFPISRKKMFPTGGWKVRQRCPKCLLRIQWKFSRRKLFCRKFNVIHFFGQWPTNLRISGEIIAWLFRIDFYVTTGLHWWKLSFLKQTGVQFETFFKTLTKTFTFWTKKFWQHCQDCAL